MKSCLVLELTTEDNCVWSHRPCIFCTIRPRCEPARNQHHQLAMTALKRAARTAHRRKQVGGAYGPERRDQRTARGRDELVRTARVAEAVREPLEQRRHLCVARQKGLVT